MSHPEQLGFFRLLANANQSLLMGASVLEIGSYDENGSVRSIFKEARQYVGVDLTPGPGVDIVAFGHEVSFADDSVDIVISAECLEHDPTWAQTFANMTRMTRSGGLVAVTCGGYGRVEHGTSRTLPIRRCTARRNRLLPQSR